MINFIKLVLCHLKKDFILLWFKNFLILIVSILWNLRNVLYNKTFMAVKFIRPINLKINNTNFKLEYYYDIPFLLSDYHHIMYNIDKDTLFVDIWAHFGEATYRYFQKFKQGYSILFEPNLYNIDMLKKNLNRYRISNYRIYETWLWNETGIKKFYYESKLSQTGNFDIWGWKYMSKFNIDKLDNMDLKQFREKFPNILFKIDVEGFEVETIKWMKKTLLYLINKGKHIKFVIEIMDHANLKKILKVFHEHWIRYEYKQITDRDFLILIK